MKNNGLQFIVSSFLEYLLVSGNIDDIEEIYTIIKEFYEQDYLLNYKNTFLGKEHQDSSERQNNDESKSKEIYSTVRTKKSTNNKLNALVKIGVAKNIDLVIELMIDHYSKEKLDDEQKRILNLLCKLSQNN